MSAECYPMTVLPHISRLYAEYLALDDTPDSPLHTWFHAPPQGQAWMGRPVSPATPELADLLQQQAVAQGAGAPALANIQHLRHGARAVVTGQQVGLFGGPLLTLLKAATAIARASQATAATGVQHVPIFWLATEDHDLPEADQCTLIGRQGLETLRLNLPNAQVPVGGIPLGDSIDALLDRASELLGHAPICDLLRLCYTPQATFGSAFAQFLSHIFAAHGLIVMDASGRGFHALGKPVLRAAIERAQQLEELLLERTSALEAAGFHAQVLVKPGASLLFLLDDSSGRRIALERRGQPSDQTWKVGAQSYSTADLLAILDAAPERLSPNALLRPLFQDHILPTAAYIGGPAEIAYFAQSEVLYQAIAGHVTPVLPRFSATLIEPAIATVMAKDEVTLDQVFASTTAEELALRLGARAMPIEGKRRIASAGNALDTELSALTDYLAAVDSSLGRSALVSASKMRYQMNRLRRMAARFELQKQASLGKHAEAMMLHLFPNAHPQERLLGGIWFLAQSDNLAARLVSEAEAMCIGHAIVRL